MKRVHKSLLTALCFMGLGGGFAAYAYFRGYKTELQRESEESSQKRLFRDIGKSDVIGGVLFARGETIRFAAKQNGWQIEHPVEWPADQEALEAAIDHMVAIRRDVVVKEDASEEDLKTYGLASAHLRLSLKTRDGRELELLVGGKNDIAKGYYVTDGAKQTIGLAKDAFYWALDRDLAALRSKKLVPGKTEDVVSLRVLKNEREAYAIERTDEGFKLSKGDLSYKGDPITIERLLLVLVRDLKTETFLSDSTVPSEPPEFRAEVGLKNGEKRTLWVKTRPSESDPEEKETLVHLIGTRSLLTVYAHFAKDLDRDVKELRDRAISWFDETQVARIELTLGDGGQVELTKSEEWELSKPEKRKTKPWKVQSIVTRFSRFRSDKVEADRATAVERRQWFLDPPSRRFVFYDANGAILAHVRLGKLTDDKRFYITSDAAGERVDLVDPSKLDVLPNTLDDLIE